MPIEPDSLESIARQQDKTLTELAIIREEVKSDRQDNRSLQQSLMLISDRFSRHERRLSEIKADVATTINLEVGGANAILENRIEQCLDAQSREIHRMIHQAVFDIAAAGKND